jgi:tetratricopeptide (TPR) repeat protein
MKERKLYILITIVITLWLHPGCSGSSDTTPSLPKADPGAISASVAEADALFRQREDPSKIRQAVEILAKLRNSNPRHFETEWKYAKYNYFLGQRTRDDKERTTAYETGREAGRVASTLEPTKPDGYFWYAANLGELSNLSPVTVGLKSVNDIKDAMNKVIELQPDYQDSSAYDALAQVELGSRLYGGTPEKAIELLEKALQTEKRNVDLRIHLAEAYLAVKRNNEAKHQIELALQTQPDPDYMPEYKESIEEARKMLRTKF